VGQALSLTNTEIELIKLIRITGMRESVITPINPSENKNWEKISRVISNHKGLLAMGEKHTRQKAIQDPVHGAILLEPWELDIISSWEMLRLQFVKQLGPTHIVYPGATHTRYQHCLGTNFLAQKCIRVVNYCEDLDNVCFVPLSNLLDSYNQKLFRIAALLHDVGHPPSSHTIEFPLQCWADIDHTDLGEFLILHSDLKDVLERNDIEPRKIVEILKRRTNDPVLSLLSDFLDHPLDIDKTDYLIRDAYYSGVRLGVFPAERVLLTNRVVKNEKGRYIRAFMMKALHSLESLILSRNWMFADLYLHHAVRIAQALIAKATYFRMKEEKLTRNECIGLFTRMTDAELHRWLEESDIKFIGEYINRIKYRRLFKVVVSRPVSSFTEDTQIRLRKMRKDIEYLIEEELELVDDYGGVIVDVVRPAFGRKVLRKTPFLVGGESEGISLISLEEMEEGSPLIRILDQQKETIPTVRVYSDPHIATDVLLRFEKQFPVKSKSKYIPTEFDMTET
jgi:HD superfamily phosphohydrolase